MADQNTQEVLGKGWSKGMRFSDNNRVCEVCGTSFHVRASILARSGNTGRFCSKSCKGKGTRGEKSGLRKEKLAKSCPVCCSIFEVYPSQADRVHCSRGCAGIARRTRDRANLLCEACGEDRPVNRQRFCSAACAYTGRKGDKSPRWRGGGRVKSVCVGCGKDFAAYRPDVERGYGKYCSQGCAASTRIRNGEVPAYPTARGGKRTDLDDMYFRSAWEANYARYLNWLKRQGEIRGWEYEPDTFEFGGIKRGTRFYTPDFRIENKSGSIEYHEIKGYMDKASATKLKRMAKYYPNIRVVLIDKFAYKDLAKQVQGFIPNWEKGTTR